MASGNGDYSKDRMQGNRDALLAHARHTDKQIEMLRTTVKDTNASALALIRTIRDLIDRIPPENLR